MGSTSAEAEARDALTVLADAMAEAGLQSVLIGGHAVNQWVTPRYTADIDLTVTADIGALQRAVAALQREGFRTALEQAGGASGPDFLRLESPAFGRVELQAAKTAYQRLVIDRAIVTPELPVPLATAEDLIVLKLIANRPRDHVDLLQLAALPGLDWSYVQRWAGEWGVSDALRELRARSGPSPGDAGG